VLLVVSATLLSSTITYVLATIIRTMIMVKPIIIFR
jgi:hypothetical protein